MIFASLLLAASLSAGNAEFDRAASEGAARITMARYADEIRTKGLSEGILKEAMLKNPGGFKSAEEAKEACREYYLAKAKELFAHEAGEVRRRLSLDDSVAFEFTEKDIEALAALFPKVFECERKEAVSEQAKRIVASTRPSEAEFDSKDDGALRAMMVERIAGEQATPVFEENIAYISANIVDPVIKSARAERKRQSEYLMRAKSDALAPSKLSEDLKSRLEANVERRAKTEDAADVWGVFPSVIASSLPEAVEKRVLDRLESFISEARLEVSVDAVADAVQKDPAKHATARESEKVFALIYGAEVLSNSVAAIIASAAEGEREELREFLGKHMSDGRVSGAVGKLVRREVMPKWKAARQEVAERMAKSVWPELEDGTWAPPPDLADELLARSDYAKALKEWRNIGELKTLASAGGGKAVMEEALARADKRVASAFELARNAIAAQNRIVDGVHGSVLDAARSKKDGLLSRTPQLGDIVAMLTEATEKEWGEERCKTLWPEGNEPTNAEEQHVSLYPSVRRKIELVARKILEEMNIPKPEDPEPKPETPEESAEDSDSEEELLEFTISVSKTASGVEVKLLKGKDPVVERTVDGKFAPFDGAMREVTKRLGKDLLKLP